jgi:TetR/AcrR family transcriptional regulator, regulator of autoinduction and epiphytic fitness
VVRDDRGAVPDDAGHPAGAERQTGDEQDHSSVRGDRPAADRPPDRPTPLTAVAAEAGVAIQTVYKVFGSKRNLLSALVDVTVAGDDDPVPLPARQFVADIEALPGARAKLGRYAAHLTEVHARQAQVMTALAGAATADPDAAAIWRKNQDDRRRGMTMFAAVLMSTGEVRPDHTVDTVADVLWLAMDVRNYDWLVRERGWSVEQFQRWYVDSVAAAVLGAQP